MFYTLEQSEAMPHGLMEEEASQFRHNLRENF
jgi:hypothetical protein